MRVHVYSHARKWKPQSELLWDLLIYSEEPPLSEAKNNVLRDENVNEARHRGRLHGFHQSTNLVLLVQENI